MKIIYLVHQFFPEYQTGTEKFVLNNALMSQKAGNKVKVVTYSFLADSEFSDENNGILSRDYFYQSIPVYAFKFLNPPNFFDIALTNQPLYILARKFLEQENPDLIHVGHPMRVHEFVNAAVDLGIPYIMTLTDFFMLCPKVILTPNTDSLCSGPLGGSACRELCPELGQNFIKTRLRQAEKTLRNAKALVAPSDFVINMFNQEYKDLNINIIHHGIQHRYIKPNKRTYQHGDELTFGFAGTIMPHKGVHLLVRAFREINNSNIQLKIYGAGPRDFMDQLQNMINLDDRISICGEYASEQIGDIFKGIDVLIVPSMCYENYSMVLHEAFASNVPVIATNLGALGEKIMDGLNGFSFSVGDSEDLKQKMLNIIDDPQILNKMKSYIRKNEIVLKIEQETYENLRIYFGITAIQ